MTKRRCRYRRRGSNAYRSPGIGYLNNRHYDPTVGVFVSVDPLVTMTGDPYIYGSADPVTKSDPSGLCPYTGCWEAFLSGYVAAVQAQQAGGDAIAASRVGSTLSEALQRESEVNSLSWAYEVGAINGNWHSRSDEATFDAALDAGLDLGWAVEDELLASTGRKIKLNFEKRNSLLCSIGFDTCAASRVGSAQISLGCWVVACLQFGLTDDGSGVQSFVRHSWGFAIGSPSVSLSRDSVNCESVTPSAFISTGSMSLRGGASVSIQEDGSFSGSAGVSGSKCSTYSLKGGVVVSHTVCG